MKHLHIYIIYHLTFNKYVLMHVINVKCDTDRMYHIENLII
jgi:hypothetical protein